MDKDENFKDETDLTKKGNRRSRRSKDRRRGKDFKSKGGTVKQDNSWFLHYPKLLEASARIAWSRIAGTGYTGINGSNALSEALVYRIPFIPVPGLAGRDYDAINTMARTLWLAMHRKYRGIGSYEQSDLGITMFAIVDAFVELARAERVYGILNNYNVLNRAIPYQLVAACRVSYASFTDIADYRYRLNRLIMRAKSLCLPSGFDILKRHLTMLTNIFKDSDSNRAGMFVYDTAGYWVYDPTALKSGGCLRFKEHTASVSALIGALQTPGDIIADLEDQFERLLNDTDVARICSDILAAIGENNADSDAITKLMVIPEDYVVLPVKQDDWLREIHNIHNIDVDESLIGSSGHSIGTDIPYDIIPSTPVITSPELVIYQHYNIIVCDIAWTYYMGSSASYVAATDGSLIYGVSSTNLNSMNFLSASALLDTWDENPAAVSIAEIAAGVNLSKFSIVAPTSSTKQHRFKVTTCCAELYLKPVTYHYNPVSNTIGLNSVPKIVASTATAATLNLDFTHFDWAPLLYVMAGSSIADNVGEYDCIGTVAKVVGDLDNAVSVKAVDLDRVHDASVLSFFSIPWTSTILKED